MENNKNEIFGLMLFLLVSLFVIYMMSIQHKEYQNKITIEVNQTCKEDSLKRVIDSLHNDIKTLEDGFDSKEKRYENIIWNFSHKPSKLKPKLKISEKW